MVKPTLSGTTHYSAQLVCCGQMMLHDFVKIMSGFIIELDRPWQFFQFNCFADWFCSPFAFYKSCKTNVYKTVACEFYGVLFSLYLLKILLSTDQRLQQVNWTECPSDLHPAIFRKHVRILYDPHKLFLYFIHFVVN